MHSVICNFMVLVLFVWCLFACECRSSRIAILRESLRGLQPVTLKPGWYYHLHWQGDPCSTGWQVYLVITLPGATSAWMQHNKGDKDHKRFFWQDEKWKSVIKLRWRHFLWRPVRVRLSMIGAEDEDECLSSRQTDRSCESAPNLHLSIKVESTHGAFLKPFSHIVWRIRSRHFLELPFHTCGTQGNTVSIMHLLEILCFV